MTIESALSFFIAILIFSVTPGPGVFAILARAMTRGAANCWLLALGMTISDILYLIAACFGLAAIAHNWNDAFTAIRIIGALYLCYLGWKMWNAPLQLDSVEHRDSKSSQLMSFIQGFLISASNPKVILFYIAFLPSFIDIESLNGGDILLACGLTLVALMTGLMLIALFAARARRWLQSEAAVKRMNRSAGSIMIAAAGYLASRH